MPYLLLCLAFFSGLFTVACGNLDNLRSAKPIAPIKTYEALLGGSLEADYIGDDNCLKSCHKHDKIAFDFKHSIHGEQISEETGLPLVNCESCHGPGSLAVEHATETGKCEFKTLIPLEEIPAQAQSMICLKCHSAASTPILHNWMSSTHASNDVSCFDCHKLHKGSQQKVDRREQEQICYSCHQETRMQFAQLSHHPLHQKVVCSDCHDAHGGTREKSLRGGSTRETCTRCHMEYQGPFVYEHADITEDCINCHLPHGSPNKPLLQVTQPFLCLQCHAGHFGEAGALDNNPMKQAFYNRCTDCHSAIHGTDIPSAHGRGSFIAR